MDATKMRKQISGKQAVYLAVLLFLTGILCVYVVSIFYINFSRQPTLYVTDMYADVLVSVKMWEQKSFVPEGWVFSNQIYVMATPNLAALIYGITGKEYWSMAAASCVMTVLVLLSFDWMLKAALRKPAERLFGIVILLSLPVFFGDTFNAVNGWQLLFTMCSYYACYAINAFLAFGCYIRKDIRVPAAMIGFVCLMSFAMGVQSLRQTAVMTLPLLAMEFLRGISRLRQKKSLRCRSLLFVLAVSICNFAGVLVNHFLDIPRFEMFGTIEFADIRYLPQAIWSSIQNICDLFDQPTNLPHRLVLLVFVILAVLLYCRTRAQANDQTKSLFALLLLSVLTIAGIDTVTTMKFREIYYFMMYPLLAFLAVYVFANRHLACKVLMLLALCAVFYFSYTDHVRPICRWLYSRPENTYYQISKDLLERGYTTVYSTWNGCQKIAIASQGKIEAGFWVHNGKSYVASQYLCDPTVLSEEPEHAAYVFYWWEDTVPPITEQFREAGIELVPVLEYPEEGISIYTAPVNLMQVLIEMEAESGAEQ